MGVPIVLTHIKNGIDFGYKNTPRDPFPIEEGSS